MCVAAKRNEQVVMLGLDAAGKTTILYKLHIGEVLSTVPTIGRQRRKEGRREGLRRERRMLKRSPEDETRARHEEKEMGDIEGERITACLCV